MIYNYAKYDIYQIAKICLLKVETVCSNFRPTINIERRAYEARDKHVFLKVGVTLRKSYYRLQCNKKSTVIIFLNHGK